MSYEEFLAELKSRADEKYREFHKKLLKNDKINVLGVRVPELRKIAGRVDPDAVFAFPDEYYEVTFIKLTAVSYLPYEKFINYADGCVALIDNWASCDCFTPACIIKHKEEFLPYIYKYLSVNKEFYQRFALTTLLHYYVEEKYYREISDIIKNKINPEFYYVHMAAAWLVAELIIKFYDETVKFLRENRSGEYLNKKTHNKAIQKACESFRLSDAQKKYLKGLKI